MKRLLDSFYFNLFLSILWMIFTIYIMLFDINMLFGINKIPYNFFFYIPFQDKIFHFIDFFVLSYLILKTLEKSVLDFNLNTKIITVALMILFSIIIEYQQSLISYRNFEIMDIIFNTIGITVGLLIKLRY